MPKSTKSPIAAALAQVLSLSPADQARVLSRLKKQLHGSASVELESLIQQINDQKFRRGFECPHCHGDKVVRNGHQNGHQTFECHSCDKFFSEHTHTPMNGLHKPEKWLNFVECELLGYSLRKSADAIEIAVTTAWMWRQKLLGALKRAEPEAFKDILETDETYFRENQKGNKNIVGRDAYKRGTTASKRGISKEQVCVVVARDRTGTTKCQVAGLGPISKAKAEILLGDSIDGVTSLCSDANGVWRAFATAVGVDHKELNQSKKARTKGIHHIQNVNAFHSRLKSWMRDYKGVASKHLDNYLALFRFVDAHRGEITPVMAVNLIVAACLPISPDRYQEIRATEFVVPAPS